MTNHRRGLERLSPELLDAIVSDLSTRDRASLCQASQHLHEQVAPSIYNAWSYNGHSHSFKSLYCFLRTLILRPWLAPRVKTLDIGKWGDCYRRLGRQVLKTPNAAADRKAKEETGQGRMSMNATYEDDFETLRRDLQDLKLGGRIVSRFEQGIRDRDENFLLALIISKLHNLETLYLLVPQSWKPVYNMLLQESENGSRICHKLHTVYIGQSLIRSRGHEQYFLDLLNSTIPVAQIPSLRSLYTLTSHTFESPRSHNRLKAHSAKSLGLTELVLDESLIKPEYLLKLLTLPKALISFRWSQVDDHISGVQRPHWSLQRALVDGLKVQNDSLQALDLNGIEPTPPYNAIDLARKEYLVGSLKDFVTLKTLSIPAFALCGDTRWGLATHKIADILPSSLESLNLRVNVILAGPEKKAQGIWMDRMVELALEAGNRLPALRKVTLVATNDWRPTKEDNRPFGRLEDVCLRAKIGFEVRREPMFGISTEPYFQRIRFERLW